MNEIYDVIILGAGIAGMTAAIYARRANKTVLVVEGKVPGGQIVNATDVRNWPGEERISGENLTQKIYHQVNNFGAKVLYEVVESVKKDGDLFEIATDEGAYKGRSVIIATGSRDKELGVPGEKELVGHGVSYCVTCDGELYKGQDVAVVGGGNTAIYDTLYLANLARKVYLVHRRPQFRADAALVEQVQKLKNVELLLGQIPERIIGESEVEGLMLKNETLPVKAVFVAVGRTPETEVVQGLVDLDENGYIIAGEDCHTSVLGVFAAGDCRTKQVRQLVTAAGDGAVAAGAAVEYLNQK